MINVTLFDGWMLGWKARAKCSHEVDGSQPGRILRYIKNNLLLICQQYFFLI